MAHWCVIITILTFQAYVLWYATSNFFVPFVILVSLWLLISANLEHLGIGSPQKM